MKAPKDSDALTHVIWGESKGRLSDVGKGAICSSSSSPFFHETNLNAEINNILTGFRKVFQEGDEVEETGLWVHKKKEKYSECWPRKVRCTSIVHEGVTHSYPPLFTPQ